MGAKGYAALAFVSAVLAGLACGSRSGLDQTPVGADDATGDASFTDATLDASTDAPEAAVGDSPAFDAPLADASDSALPPVCTVDPNAPGSAYWALQAGGCPPNNDGQGFIAPIATALDREGNLVMVGNLYGIAQLGSFTLTSAPLVVAGYPSLSHSSSFDVFVAKVDPSGKVLFAKSFGDGGFQSGEALALDAAGNIFVAGEFASTISFGGSTAPLATGLPPTEGTSRAFLAKLDPQGNAVFSLAFGQADYVSEGGVFIHGANATAVGVDPTGAVVLTGYFGGTIDLSGGTSSAAKTISSVGNFGPREDGLQFPGGDGFVTKLTNTGDYLFGETFGTPGSFQEPVQLQVGADGSMVLAGVVQGSIDLTGHGGSGGAAVLSSPTVCAPGTAQPPTAFLAKLDSSGSFVWGQTFPANGLSQVEQLAMDPAGNLVLSASFTGSSDFLDAGYVPDAALPGADAGFGCVQALDGRPWTTFLARLDGDGGRTWVHGTGQHFTNTSPIAVDEEGSIYLGGENEAPLVGGYAQWLATLSKIDAQGQLVWARVYGVTGGSFFTTLAVDSCSAELFGGGTFGTYPTGSSMSFPGVDGVTLAVTEDGGGYPPPIDMFLARAVP